MFQKKVVRVEETVDAEVGRELTENELATICGGSGNSSVPSTLGSGNSYNNFPDLTHLFDPQAASTNAPGNTPAHGGKSTSFPGLNGMGSLSNLTNNLLGGFL